MGSHGHGGDDLILRTHWASYSIFPLVARIRSLGRMRASQVLHTRLLPVPLPGTDSSYSLRRNWLCLRARVNFVPFSVLPCSLSFPLLYFLKSSSSSFILGCRGREEQVMKVLIPEGSDPACCFRGSWTSCNLTVQAAFFIPLDCGSHTRVYISTSGQAW